MQLRLQLQAQVAELFDGLEDPIIAVPIEVAESVKVAAALDPMSVRDVQGVYYVHSWDWPLVSEVVVLRFSRSIFPFFVPMVPGPKS